MVKKQQNFNPTNICASTVHVFRLISFQRCFSPSLDLNNLKNMIVPCINNGYVWNLICCMESVNDCMTLLACWLILLWERKDVIGKFHRH